MRNHNLLWFNRRLIESQGIALANRFKLQGNLHFKNSTEQNSTVKQADAQDLKSWDLKTSCGLEFHHRHHLNLVIFQRMVRSREGGAGESAGEINTR
jgi:hypothetical protein